MTHKSIEELKAGIEASNQRLHEAVREIISLVAADIPGYFLRESKRAFIQSLEYSEMLSDEAVRDVKAKSRQRGKETADKVSAALSAPALWAGDDVAAAEGKVLEQNTKVWEVLQTIGAAAAALLAELSLFDADAEALVYQTPTWFVDGKYAPGLIDKYWTELGHIRDLQAELASREQESRKEALETRWNTL